jgi:putative DNA primase/helicase
VCHFVQQVAGVGLLGAVHEHILTILTGTGANGKSVFDHAIRFTLGDYAITAEPDLFMHRDGAHPTGEMDLRGVRWVSVSESDKDRRLAEATVKRLTGGDTVRARRMRQDFVEFEASHTAVLITNHLPKVSGDDPAIWRRLRVVPFDVVIPEDEQDRGLGEKLAAEADAILSWIVDGFRDYLKTGKLAEPARVRTATDAYHTASDAVSRFIAECCVTGHDGQHGRGVIRSTTTELHKAWVGWQIQDGCEPLGIRAFGLALDNKGYPTSAPSQGNRYRKGIGLKAEWLVSNDS